MKTFGRRITLASFNLAIIVKLEREVCAIETTKSSPGVMCLPTLFLLKTRKAQGKIGSFQVVRATGLEPRTSVDT